MREHDHGHTLSTMSDDRMKTLTVRDGIIKMFVMRSPVWLFDKQICELALELVNDPSLQKPELEARKDEIAFSRFLIEMRLMTLGWVMGPKEIHVESAEWNGEEGEYNALVLSQNDWTESFREFCPALCFHGTLFFNDEMVGRGILVDTRTGFRLERAKRLKTWVGVRSGNLRWAPDPGPQSEMPRGMNQVQVIGQVDPNDPAAMAAANAVIPPDPRLN